MKPDPVRHGKGKLISVCLTQNRKVCIFHTMIATLTQLRRNTTNVLDPVIHGGKELTLTEHGKEVARILPQTPVDRKRAVEVLRRIGPVDVASRK